MTAPPIAQNPVSAGLVPRSIRVLGPVVLALAVALYVAAYLRWPSLADQIDLLVYRFGASRAWDGQDLYSVVSTGNSHTMLFDYTPFAALCFLPLIWLGPLAVLAFGLAVNVLCVGYVFRRMLVVAGLTAATGLWDQLLPAAYLLVFLLVLAGSAWALSRGRRPEAVTGSPVPRRSERDADLLVR